MDTLYDKGPKLSSRARKFKKSCLMNRYSDNGHWTHRLIKVQNCHPELVNLKNSILGVCIQLIIIISNTQWSLLSGLISIRILLILASALFNRNYLEIQSKVKTLLVNSKNSIEVYNIPTNTDVSLHRFPF